jgi:hypothetical protein
LLVTLDELNALAPGSTSRSAVARFERAAVPLNHAAAKLSSLVYRGAPPTTLSKTTGATLICTRGPATFRYATHRWIIRGDTPNILAIR